MEVMSQWARDTMLQKYSHEIEGRKEEWPEIAMRATKNVLGALNITEEQSIFHTVYQSIRDRKFIPGGRYLYASGRPFHQVQNCLLLRAYDSREGWADLMQRSAMALMTGAGIGIDYSGVREEGAPIRKTGGFATGPCALMQILNEAGRGIMQGGSRRSAIWAGLNWKHPDIFRFMGLKNWPEEIRKMKEKDFNAYAPMDMTNISVLLDDAFFLAYKDKVHPDHEHAQKVYWQVVSQMMMNGEPGFSIDVGANAGETLRNAPVGPDTHVLTAAGYVRVGDIVGEKVSLWTGKRFADATFLCTKRNTRVVKVLMSGGREIICDPTHEFLLENGLRVPASSLLKGQDLLMSGFRRTPHGKSAEAYTLGYVYGDGSFHQKYPRAEITFCTEEKKRCIEYCDNDLFVSVNPCDSRGFTRAYTKNNPLFSNRNKAVFPSDVYEWSADRKASFIAGLFDSDGNYFPTQNRVRYSSKHRDFLVGVQRLLDDLGIRSGISTAGISTFGKSQGWTLTVVTEDVSRFSQVIPTVRLEVSECDSFRPAKIKVVGVVEAGYSDVFCCDVGVEEHSFTAEGVVISNCTEITSGDDDDICNIGSINMARVSSLEEMEKLVDVGTLFLLAGTVYSDIPYAKVGDTRSKNRRLGLGLMGLHEWLLQRGLPYKPSKALEPYLEIYAKSTERAWHWADMYNLSRPVKTRAIAPNGTIGIVAETTTSGEPLFAAAYIRRWLVGSEWKSRYVVDPVAKRLVEQGVDPDSIEDAYRIAENPEVRVQFQTWLQGYVDHGISSTINLPAWGSEHNNAGKIKEFGDMLFKYLPNLRGITAYPDGARGGQPLTPVSLRKALEFEGEIFVESVDICDITKSGSCGT